jgi:hypothetical protein
MEVAYTDAAGRVNPDAARINLGGGLLGGDFGCETHPLTPGVYTFGTDVNINGQIYFDGTETDVFIIQITGKLIQTANYSVNLTNGALAKNIFWQVAEEVEVDAGAHMEGIILAQTSVLFETGSSLNGGRVLAQPDGLQPLQKATIASLSLLVLK